MVQLPASARHWHAREPHLHAVNVQDSAVIALQPHRAHQGRRGCCTHSDFLAEVVGGCGLDLTAKNVAAEVGPLQARVRATLPSKARTPEDDVALFTPGAECFDVQGSWGGWVGTQSTSVRCAVTSQSTHMGIMTRAYHPPSTPGDLHPTPSQHPRCCMYVYILLRAM